MLIWQSNNCFLWPCKRTINDITSIFNQKYVVFNLYNINQFLLPLKNFYVIKMQQNAKCLKQSWRSVKITYCIIVEMACYIDIILSTNITNICWKTLRQMAVAFPLNFVGHVFCKSSLHKKLSTAAFSLILNLVQGSQLVISPVNIYSVHVPNSLHWRKRQECVLRCQALHASRIVWFYL